MLKADRRIRALDLRHSQLNDNGRERELDSVVSLSPSLLARRLGTDFFGGSPDRSAGGDTPRTRTAHLRCTRPRPGAALPSRGPHGAPVSPRPLRDTGAEPHEPQSRGTSLAVRGLVRRCSRLRILSVEAQGPGQRQALRRASQSFARSAIARRFSSVDRPLHQQISTRPTTLHLPH